MGITVSNITESQKSDRKSKIDYYLAIAEQVASRGTCRYVNSGAIIVKNDEIIATGYSGAPRKCVNCCDLNACACSSDGVNFDYTKCRSVHAEVNAIISASRKEMLGATMYIVGVDKRTGKRRDRLFPCPDCVKIIINSGISEVICAANNDVGHDEYAVGVWVCQNGLGFPIEGVAAEESDASVF